MTERPRPRKWLRAAEVATRYGLSRETILRLASLRRIPSARIGGSLMIDVQALEADLERQAAGDASVFKIGKCRGARAAIGRTSPDAIPSDGARPPKEPIGEKPLVRRGRVDSVEIYEVKENELDILKTGPASSIYINLSIFSLSIAFSSIVALCTTTTFKYPIMQTIFVVVAAVGILLGALLLILWSRGRRNISDIIRTIRSRIKAEPPGVPCEPAPESHLAEPPGPTEPKG